MPRVSLRPSPCSTSPSSARAAYAPGSRLQLTAAAPLAAMLAGPWPCAACCRCAAGRAARAEPVPFGVLPCWKHSLAAAAAATPSSAAAVSSVRRGRLPPLASGSCRWSARSVVAQYLGLGLSRAAPACSAGSAAGAGALTSCSLSSAVAEPPAGKSCASCRAAGPARRASPSSLSHVSCSPALRSVVPGEMGCSVLHLTANLPPCWRSHPSHGLESVNFPGSHSMRDVHPSQVLPGRLHEAPD